MTGKERIYHTNQMDWLEKRETRLNQYAVTAKPYRIGFTGRQWRERKVWVEALLKVDGAYPSVKYEGTPADYINRIMSWNAMLILQGKRDRHTDGKNRREAECASIRMPMILNYKPYYLNPFEAGKHYLYVEQPSDIELVLTELEARKQELAENAYQWWLKKSP